MGLDAASPKDAGWRVASARACRRHGFVMIGKAGVTVFRGNGMIDFSHIDLAGDFASLDPCARLLVRASIAKGLSPAMVTRKMYVIEGNGRAEFFQSTMPTSISCLARAACKNKDLAKRFFRENGVPTPQGLAFTPREIRKAARFMQSAGGANFVLKPEDGALGEMVFMNIDSEQKLKEKCALFPKRKLLLLEEQVEGPECRYFVLGDRVIAVAERKPASVMGDGKGTISELVRRKNAGREGHLTLKAIEIDDETRDLLSAQGMNPDTVPADGQHVRLKRVSNISQGGDSVDMTDAAHDDLKALAVSALRSIPSLRYAGVDMIARDHAAPLSGQRAVILEINSIPMLRIHHAPAVGQPRDVAGAVLDRLFFD